MTRGLFLNNPMNIRISPEPWRGKVKPSRDDEFETFDSPENGIRAGVKIILTYRYKYGLDTIRSIINRWAPPSENNTSAYIDDVSDRVGLDANSALDLDDKELFGDLIQAIIHHEQGSQPYTDAQVNDGVERAYA